MGDVNFFTQLFIQQDLLCGLSKAQVTLYPNVIIRSSQVGYFVLVRVAVDPEPSPGTLVPPFHQQEQGAGSELVPVSVWSWLIL